MKVKELNFQSESLNNDPQPGLLEFDGISWYFTDSVSRFAISVSGTTVNHNTLVGLQGGSTPANQFYHLTLPDYTRLVNNTYTKTEVNSITSGFSVTGHTHPQYSLTSHTHAQYLTAETDPVWTAASANYYTMAQVDYQISQAALSGASLTGYWNSAQTIAYGNSNWTGGTVDLSAYWTSAQTVQYAQASYYTSAHTNTILLGFSQTGHTHAFNDLSSTAHTHDDRYFTETELTNNTTNLYLNNVGIKGNLSVSGTTFYTQTLNVADNIILINSGETGSGVTHGYAGIIIDRGSLPDYDFIFQESTQNFRIGETGTTQAVATREDAPIVNGIAKWNSVQYRFDTIPYTTFLTGFTETDPVWNGDKPNYYTKTEVNNLLTGITVSGGTTNPAGINHSVQFNNNNVFGGNDQFTFDDTLSALTMGIRASGTVGINSACIGSNCKATGTASFACSQTTVASGNYAHAEGYGCTASQTACHAEGYQTNATATYSHAEGQSTTASGSVAHVEGYSNTASGIASHAEGNTNTASGAAAHVQGNANTAKGDYSHAEGQTNNTQANYSHIGGNNNYLTSASVGSAMLAISGTTGTTAYTLYCRNLNVTGDATITNVYNKTEVNNLVSTISGITVRATGTTDMNFEIRNIAPTANTYYISLYAHTPYYISAIATKSDNGIINANLKVSGTTVDWTSGMTFTSATTCIYAVVPTYVPAGQSLTLAINSVTTGITTPNVAIGSVKIFY